MPCSVCCWKPYPQVQQDELESLLLLQQSRLLTAPEQERLAHLQQQADRTMLRKAHAAALLRFSVQLSAISCQPASRFQVVLCLGWHPQVPHQGTVVCKAKSAWLNAYELFIARSSID